MFYFFSQVKIKTKSASDHHHSEIDLLDEKPEESKSQDLVDKIEEQSTQKEGEVAQDGCITAEELASNRISERGGSLISKSFPCNSCFYFLSIIFSLN